MRLTNEGFPELSANKNGSKSGAIISADEKYRYRLWRVWAENLATMVFVLQNPSTASADTDDPTIRKCIGFAKQAGFGSIIVMNVFAYRATDERELLTVTDPIGPLNREHLQAARSTPLLSRLVAAWGNRFGPKKKSIFRTGYCHAANICVSNGAYCLGTTKSGDPKHPLMLPYATKMTKWTAPAY